MIIYGISIISVCMIVGNLIGGLLGKLIGIDSNMGGVGFAMLFLVLIGDANLFSNKLAEPTVDGIKYWQDMFIPVVVAISASQDIISAISGGIVALIAGSLVVIISFALLPLLNKLLESHNIVEKAGGN